MSPLLLIPLQLALASASTDDPDTGHHHDPHHGHAVIDRASQLVPWCKAEAERRFVAKGPLPLLDRLEGSAFNPYFASSDGCSVPTSLRRAVGNDAVFKSAQVPPDGMQKNHRGLIRHLFAEFCPQLSMLVG